MGDKINKNRRKGLRKVIPTNREWTSINYLRGGYVCGNYYGELNNPVKFKNFDGNKYK